MFHYNSDLIPLRIIVVGAGGTGSRLAPSLTQFVSSVPWLNQIAKARILFIDGDEVEEKNCVRQNFIRSDIGKKKAEVIASRYGRAYDVVTGSLTRFVSTEPNQKKSLYADIKTFFGDKWEKTNFLLIMCVDSVKARMEILSTLGPFAGLIIDSGNEDDFGQVSVFHMKACDMEIKTKAYVDLLKSSSGRLTESVELQYLPFDISMYEGRVESEKSCADLDQTLAINNMVAAGIMSIVQTVTFKTHPINYQTVHYHLSGANHTTFYSVHKLTQILERTKLKEIAEAKIEDVEIGRAVQWQDDLFPVSSQLGLYEMSKQGHLKWEGDVAQIYEPILMDKALEIRDARRRIQEEKERAAIEAARAAEEARMNTEAVTLVPEEEPVPISPAPPMPEAGTPLQARDFVEDF